MWLFAGQESGLDLRARLFRRERVWVFYPEVAEDHLTVALLDRDRSGGAGAWPGGLRAGLDQYVNDRPYVASSLTSVALKSPFRTAMAGAATRRPSVSTERMHWRIILPAVACDGGEKLITRVFAPLGYAVETTRLPLDPQFPAWGQADLYTVTLEGEQTVPDMLNHLYVLLPVLDNSQALLRGRDETDKLLAHRGAWLAAHPERELIARRYLRYKRPCVPSASGASGRRRRPGEPSAKSERAKTATRPLKTPASRARVGLHEQRLERRDGGHP